MTANQSSTLRVENVPVGTEDSSLEDLFCDYGPIKRCFVVKPKKAGAKKTLGYVQFASHDDAQSAIQATQDKGIVLEGQDLKVRFLSCAQQSGDRIPICLRSFYGMFSSSSEILDFVLS